eukprot:SAG31_NODE_16335_length_713_cov_0.858306_2_plen_92_part_01
MIVQHLKETKQKPQQSAGQVVGEAIKLEDLSSAKWNDVPWAISFGVFVLGTAGIGVYKNITGAGDPCDPSPCENEGTCSTVSAEAGTYECVC